MTQRLRWHWFLPTSQNKGCPASKGTGRFQNTRNNNTTACRGNVRIVKRTKIRNAKLYQRLRTFQEKSSTRSCSTIDQHVVFSDSQHVDQLLFNIGRRVHTLRNSWSTIDQHVENQQKTTCWSFVKQCWYEKTTCWTTIIQHQFEKSTRWTIVE